MLEYVIRHTPAPPESGAEWDNPVWQRAGTLSIGHFQSNSSPHHRPMTQAKLLYDDANLYGVFRVQDRYVKCVHLDYQSDVYLDSCVEAFFQPKPELGYFSFEMNCCGALLTYYIEDETPKGDRFEKYTVIPENIGRQVEVVGSLSGPIVEEIIDAITWTVYFRIPLEYFEAYAGPVGSLRGQKWRGQFNKCAFGVSHPHGASWADLGGIDSFHQPARFGTLRFE